MNNFFALEQRSKPLPTKYIYYFKWSRKYFGMPIVAFAENMLGSKVSYIIRPLKKFEFTLLNNGYADLDELWSDPVSPEQTVSPDGENKENNERNKDVTS